jgi:uncharacterized membrane protein YagU involved in acid resistance
VNDISRSRASAAAGAVGGLAGGTAMTVLMTQVARRLLPHDLLPDTPAPQKVVQWAQDEVGAPQTLTGRSKTLTALATHLAYSAASGAAYGLARPALPPLRSVPTPAAGALFGWAVWAASFQGLLPALGVMPRTTQHPPKRWPAPLMGHAVFGAVTAVVASRLDKRLA